MPGYGPFLSPLGELDGPYEEEVLCLAVPRDELDAGHEVDRPDGFVDGDVAVCVYSIEGKKIRK